MSTTQWLGVVVVAVWFGTFVEHKWLKWRRHSKAVVVEDYDLARDKQFVLDLRRAIDASRHRSQPVAEEAGKLKSGARASD